MKYILIFVLLAGAFSFDYTDEQNDDPAPYLVYIKNQYSPCVGVLIHQQWVLAAAHCYLPSLKVKLGNFKKRVRDGTEQTIKSVQIIRYWNLTTDSSNHNLMLIKLSKPAVLNEKVQPMGLPTKSVPAGTKCIISGLDWSIKNNGKHPDLRQTFTAPLLSDKECQKTKQGKGNKNRICVKFLKSFNRIFVEAILAAVICKDKIQGIEVGNFLVGDIGVYTNIFNYIPWIQKIMSTR
ncbi:probable inactive serine protease 37 [Monodelphis domestica]|uniref:Serine protease 37 n=1 Tax=Monodelphis domestica TaxID=13616 RepID=F7G5G1_MONDO|nr:probable inactive serine protease 37 [Monodelphis domestica]